MRIAICSSALFAKQSREIKEKLEKRGFEVFLYPQKVEVNGKMIDVGEYHRMRKSNLTQELLKTKRKLIDEHIEKIKNSDAILVLNLDKGEDRGYVGGNTFLEMGIAYCLGKKVFVWKRPSENLPYFEEIMALNPILIEENLEKIG
jgi:nucleoside 2-deoxyribosyltransferase